MGVSSIFKSVIILIGAQFLAMVLAFGINAYLANDLGPEIFGAFSLILSIVAFGSMVLNFGFYPSVGLLIGEETYKRQQQELIGAILIIFIMLSCLAVLAILIFGRFLNDIFEANIHYIFTSLWFLIIFWPVRELSIQIAKGLGSSNLIALTRISIPFIFGGLLLLSYFSGSLDLLEASFAQFFALLLFFILFLLILKPKFTNLKEKIRLIIEKTKNYGSKIYLGSLSANTWPDLLIFYISFYGTFSDVAVYKVSLLIISPLVLVGQNLALYLFRKLVGKSEVDKNLFLGNMVIAVLLAVIFILMADIIVSVIFGNDYQEVVVISRIMVVGAMLCCIYQVPDAYMNANSKGKEVLYSSIIMGATAVISAVILISEFGLLGAAITYVLANIVYLTAITFFYNRVLTRRKS